ncbi:cytochrome P450 [Stella sp.]|uniref:cytochrome P450 n=1 Tax=Stella sp. TaxID=2912054 RepID=UPI0035AF79CB
MTTAPLRPFDPRDPRLRSDPHGLFALYRSAEPVHWSETAHSWILTRHRDISGLLRSPGLDPASVLAFSDAVAARVGRNWPALQSFIDAILFLDASAGHRQARRLLAATLNARPLSEYAPMIAGVAEEMLAPLRGERAFDVVARFTDPLPFRVMCRIMGVPDDVGAHLYAISRSVLRLFNFVLGVREMEDFERWLSAAFAEIARLVDARRRVPREDGMTRLMELARNEEGVDDRWLHSRILFLVLVGAETTSAFLGSAIRRSLDEPEVRRAAADPARLPQVVEELLRLDSPVILAARRATADIVVDGRTFPAGSGFIPYITAGNRDPEAYPDPDRFQPGRSGPGNLAFGEGAHACLGGALARLEARVVLPAFFAAIPPARPGEPADEWVPLDTFRRLARLPILVDGPDPECQ